MALTDIQRRVDEWVSRYREGYWKPHEIYARLGEEVGELAREINHLYGPKPKKSSEDKKELGEEMADIIFTLCCLANSLGIDLEDAFSRVMEKYSRRDDGRWEKK